MVSKVVDIGLRGLQVCEISATAPGIGFLTALQFLWTLLIMALVGNIIADATSGNPSIINYDMFVAVFAMLSIIFLLASAFTGVMSGTPIPLGLDILNTLFFFCGAVAMSAQLGVHSCSNRVSCISTRLPFKIRGLTTLNSRTTSTATVSPTAQTTDQSAAENHKPQRHSCGSPS